MDRLRTSEAKSELIMDFYRYTHCTRGPIMFVQFNYRQREKEAVQPSLALFLMWI